jgi:competence protein ComEC
MNACIAPPNQKISSICISLNGHSTIIIAKFIQLYILRMKTSKLFYFFLILSLLCTEGCLPKAQPILSVHFINVGQGDSILIDIGDTEVLIDGGEKSPGIAGYIRPYVQGKLEAIVATHPHEDHIGGLIEVIQQFEVSTIWINGDNSTSNTYANFLSLANAEHISVYEARRGNSIQAGELTLLILNPGQPLTMDANNNSIVLTLRYGNTDFLFTGDAGFSAEVEMLADSTTSLPDIDILKVGHHGSYSSTSQDFLTVIRPEVAIYEAGTGNSYGHPHKETINRLKANGVTIYGTDKNGSIVVTTDGNSYNVRVQKGTYQN